MEHCLNLDVRDLEGEQWVQLSDDYKVSNLGRIKLFRPYNGSYIKALYLKNGYNYVELRLEGTSKRYRVCRLVANSFLSNPDNKPVVNHKDGSKRNDAVTNLEWNTSSENMYHAYAHGLKKPTRKKN